MKRLSSFLSLAVFAALIVFANAPAQLQAQSALTFKVYASPAPNRNATLGLPYYNTWAGYALDSVENGKGNIGSGPAAFIVRDSFTPREFLVTENPSWLGNSNPSPPFHEQYGSRIHFVLHVKGNGTVRFKIEDIRWDWWSNGNRLTIKRSLGSHTNYDSARNAVDGTYGYAYDWGTDRAKGGGDDTKVVNNTTSLVDELFYVGAAIGLCADCRWNKPVGHPKHDPQFIGWTRQQVIHAYCNHYNNADNIKQIGMKFLIDGNDGTTYENLRSYSNPEFGQQLALETCAPPVQPTPPPPTPTGVLYTAEVLQSQGYTVSAAKGLRSGVQAQQRSASAVGVQSVLDAGFIDAVDVWGYAEQTVTVCFPQAAGALVFLDATITPRVAAPMQATMQSGKICGTTNGPGLIVLVDSWPGSDTVSADQVESPLSDCMVTTQYNLNFRDGPGGSIIGLVPVDSTLTAVARTDLWFKVDYYGVKGWIYAEYVDTRGSCD